MSRIKKYETTEKNQQSISLPIPVLADVQTPKQDESSGTLLKVQEDQRPGEKSDADKKIDAILDEFSESKDELKDTVDLNTKGQPKTPITEPSTVEPKIVHTINLKHGYKIVFQDSEIEPVEHLTVQQIEHMTDAELMQTAIFKALAPKSDIEQQKLVKKLRKYWNNKKENGIINKIFNQIFGWSTAVFGVTVLPFTLGMISGLMGQRFHPTETSSFAFEPEWFFIG